MCFAGFFWKFFALNAGMTTRPGETAYSHDTSIGGFSFSLFGDLPLASGNAWCYMSLKKSSFMGDRSDLPVFGWLLYNCCFK